MDTILRCPLCARLRSDADIRGLGWSSHHGPSGVVWVCGTCTRANLVDIELGLLDPARMPSQAPVPQEVPAQRAA
ncbi:hypothetical protein [Pseudonocardia phyllosphaerae]|uniref:hypothetical protein n=1 Tax=Pseudonocardia phyllosphaerae TaxID=3390502 RepID=UPI003979356E